MKRLLLALALVALGTDIASAAGRARYVLEGQIKVRFYYDQAFFSNGYFNYLNLPADLMNGLNYSGTYALGLKFVQDTSSYNPQVNMGSKQSWSDADGLAWLRKNLPIETGIVKVLIHSRAMTPDASCETDTQGGSSTWRQGVTYRALPSGGKASSHLMITAKSGCSVNSSALIGQTELKDTFVHEVGHALAHPGNYSGWAECSTPPQGSIMCHGVDVRRGVRRTYQKWFASDIRLIRTEVFDTSAKQYPAVQCYEYSSYQQCDTECINTAGFPSQGATEIYERCRRDYCDKMCR